MKVKKKHRYWLLVFAVIIVAYYRPALNFIELTTMGNKSEAIIKQYLPALARAYRNNDPSLIKNYVNDEEYKKTATGIQSTSRRGQRLISSLNGFEIKYFKKEGAQMQMVTDEHWTYKYVDAKTNKVMIPERKQNYLVRYTLALEGDEPIVTHIWVQDRH